MAKDGLTEIFNKRKFEEELQREFARAARHQRPLSLIIFDLDEFKTINDTYGHLCGDFILKQIASLARNSCAPSRCSPGWAGTSSYPRPRDRQRGRRGIATKLRDQIVGHDHRYGDIRINVGCSFGVAELTREMTTPQDLYHAAETSRRSPSGTAGTGWRSISAPVFSRPSVWALYPCGPEEGGDTYVT